MKKEAQSKHLKFLCASLKSKSCCELSCRTGSSWGPSSLDLLGLSLLGEIHHISEFRQVSPVHTSCNPHSRPFPELLFSYVMPPPFSLEEMGFSWFCEGLSSCP